MARLVTLTQADDCEAQRSLSSAAVGLACEVESVPWGSPEAVASARPDLIALCLADSREGAVEATRELVTQPSLSGVPVLVVGSGECEESLLACVEAGAVDCLVLPLHHRLVQTRIQALLSARLGENGANSRVLRLEQRARALENTIDALRASDRGLQSAQRRQRYLTTHDTLTGLPNRLLFREFTDRTLAYAARHRQTVAVVCLDLDRFQSINDNLGHAAGDRLLEHVARQLTGCVRRSDMVARLSGDEFAVLVVNLRAADDVRIVAEKIYDKISEPTHIDGQKVFVTPSIGLAVFPEHGESPEALIGHAGAALKWAKEEGRAHYKFYREEMSGEARERMRLEQQLREAIDRDELCLYYQPQVDARKGELIGAEGLLRWIHPELGLVPPNRFIPIAEDTGLIGRIGEWVIREACRQKRAWERAGHGEFPVSVNVSFKQLKAGDLVEIVEAALKDSGLDPTHLDLEITENSIMDDLEMALASLERIERMGVRISIDDFGTGYSSLSVLGKFPAHTLKIDQVFVRHIERDATNAAITRTVLAIAQELGLTTLAEGVETAEEMNFLGELGIVRMQGYLFDRPLPAQIFAEGWGADPMSSIRLRER